MGKLKKVRERNGQIVPFREARLIASIHAAVRDSGAEDAVLADELAGVVVLFLEKRFDDTAPPSLDDIRVLCAKVLADTGHERVAQSYLRLNANPHPTPLPTTGAIEVLHPGNGLMSAWNASESLEGMLTDAGLSAVDARAVAVSVESRLLAAGLARVHGSLVREFLDVELSMRGKTDVLRRTRLLGVPFAEIERWIENEASGADPERLASAAVLEDYTLEAVYSKTVALAHAEGRIHLFGLGHPQRVESVSISAIGPAFPHTMGVDDFLLHLLTLLTALAPLVRRRVVIRDFSKAFARLAEKPGPRRMKQIVKRLIDHLLKVDVFGRPAYPHVTLEIDVPARPDGTDAAAQRTGDLALHLLRDLEARAALGGRLGLVFILAAAAPYHWPESETLDSLLSAARRHRGAALRLVRTENEPAAPPERVLLDIGAVGVNLPYVFAEAGIARTEEIPAALAEPVKTALDALAEKYWYLRSSAPQTLRGVLSHLIGGAELRIMNEGQSGRLLFWGLPQCLDILERRGVISTFERPTTLATILEAADYLAGEPHEGARLNITIGGVEERAARRRFVDALGRLVAITGDERAAEALARFSEESPAFPLVEPILSPANAVVLNSHALGRMSHGLPLPSRGSDAIVGGLWLKRLFEQTRLEYFEMEERPDSFEVQEHLFGTPA